MPFPASASRDVMIRCADASMFLGEMEARMKRNRDGEASSAKSCIHFTYSIRSGVRVFYQRLLLYGYIARRYKKHQ